MDSLTQIVLGAACGEAVAGRKIGNRAMLWGAIGGTIPDLDVFAAFFTDEITATSFHRGFMHSFLFAGIAPWILAWLVRRFYESNIHHRKGYRLSMMVIWVLFYLGAAAGINFIPVLVGEGLSWYIFLPTLFLGVWLVYKLWQDYKARAGILVQASYMTWVMLFFWSIFTHPILDCFTNFGTQIWRPFFDTRIQWTTVSVVDPIYTIPFALMLIAASRFVRESKTRFVLNWAGILWGCAYLGYTVWHKVEANRLFEATLQSKNITYQRYMTGPSIFNNIVWYGIAEADTAYYYGMYGFNDKQKFYTGISTIPKRHDLMNHIPDEDRAKYFLRWFSNGYYSVTPYNGDTLQVNDLRFGIMGDSVTGNNYVFPFLLFRNEKGEWDVLQNNRRRQNLEETKASFNDLWRRIKIGNGNEE